MQRDTRGATDPHTSERPRHRVSERSLETYTIRCRQLFFQIKSKNKSIDPLCPFRCCPGTGGPSSVKVNATVGKTQFLCCIVQRVLANPALPIGFPDVPSALRTGCQDREVGHHGRPSQMGL